MIETKKVLVVYYSRTGTTGRIGDEIAKAANADVEAIQDVRSRKGLFGWLRSGSEASRKKLVEIRPTIKDPSQYDLVIIGTPVWAGTMSSPVRTYIARNKDKFRTIAVFCTQGSADGQNTLRDMATLCGKTAKASLSVSKENVERNQYADQLAKFVARAAE